MKNNKNYKLLKYIDSVNKTIRIGITPTVITVFILQIISLFLVQKVYNNWYLTIALFIAYMIIFEFSRRKENKSMKDMSDIRQELEEYAHPTFPDQKQN